MELLKKFWSEESGQGMAEYGLILALVAVIVMGALGLLGGKINDTFTSLVGKFSNP